jgi:solute carrier family 13 (sodium-dependent dicarboxylate transporter), member 2/3/5
MNETAVKTQEDGPGLARKRFAFAAVLGVGLFISFGARLGVLEPPEGLSSEGMMAAGAMVIMATLWLFEVIPLAATSLLPLFLFPLLGIAGVKQVAGTYGNSIIMLLMGGFFLAKGLERWNVPMIFARVVEKWAAGSAVRLYYGLLGITCFFSMWLSNTATTLIMVTVATAAIASAAKSDKNKKEDVTRFGLALLLGIAYAANVGGLATPVGTAPNAIMIGLYDDLVQDNPLTFVNWMVLALPVVMLLLVIIALLLQKVLCRFPSDLDLGSARETQEGSLSELSSGGRRAMIIFGFTALLWVCRRDIDVGLFVIPGWSSVLGLGKLVNDASVAMFGAIIMFAMPAGEGRERVLDWNTARQIPWYLLLLFGGGLALASVFSSTGLSAWLADQLIGLRDAPLWVVVLILCAGMSLLTEVTSNTATTTLLLPLLGATAASLDMPYLYLMWPATLCASAAFILPISTPPNAIVAGAGNISMSQMARVGVWLNVIAVLLISLFAIWWLPAQVDMATHKDSAASVSDSSQ